MTVTETTHDDLPEAVADEDGVTTGHDSVHETGATSDVVDEVLVEEISIDGMCGVY